MQKKRQQSYPNTTLLPYPATLLLYLATLLPYFATPLPYYPTLLSYLATLPCYPSTLHYYFTTLPPYPTTLLPYHPTLPCYPTLLPYPATLLPYPATLLPYLATLLPYPATLLPYPATLLPNATLNCWRFFCMYCMFHWQGSPLASVPCLFVGGSRGRTVSRVFSAVARAARIHPPAGPTAGPIANNRATSPSHQLQLSTRAVQIIQCKGGNKCTFHPCRYRHICFACNRGGHGAGSCTTTPYVQRKKARQEWQIPVVCHWSKLPYITCAADLYSI